MSTHVFASCSVCKDCGCGYFPDGGDQCEICEADWLSRFGRERCHDCAGTFAEDDMRSWDPMGECARLCDGCWDNRRESAEAGAATDEYRGWCAEG